MDKKRYLEIRSRVSFDKPLLPFFEHLLMDGLLWTLLFSLAGSSWEPASIVVITLLFFRNFSLMHDATHGAVVDSKKLNDLVGLISGTLCLLPFEPWKKSHIHHHLWSGNLEKDPVMALAVNLPKMSARAQTVLTFLWRAWFPALSILQNLLFWALSIAHVRKEKSLRHTLSVVTLLAFWGAVLALTPPAWLLMNLLPGFFLYMVALEIVNLPHHLQLPALRGETRYPLWEQHETARTCLYPRWFARFAVLNFNYHAEHHMFPDAPWYRLEELHALVSAELGEHQYLDPSFKWTFENRPRTLAEVVAPAPPKTATERKDAA